ncbi:uncharacterized protein [Panulirus ornatus]|uniref:uncharacterized protein n=1 Tax=Panulirus ornatus TaxID=150431 RepID=UPI003A855036
MKTTLALTALLLVVASAQPLSDSTEEQDSTQGEDPTLQQWELDPYQLEEQAQEELLQYPDEELTVHERRKRQTRLSGGFNTERLGGGGRRDSAHVNIGRTFNRHSVTGGVNYDRTRVPGFNTNRNFGASVGYEFRPNRNTAFSVGAQHNRGTGGRSTSFGVGFSHSFGRK